MFPFLPILLFVASFITSTSGAALIRRAPQAAINVDFADPAILQVGGTWYAYATNANGVNVQLATSSDFNTWSRKPGQDALPNLPPWVQSSSPSVWAPNVVQISSNQFVLYFAAMSQNSGHHCVGSAVSSSPLGPFTPSAQALACHDSQGGAIDPSGYYDPNLNKRFVTYKVDGNSIGNGGSCGNSVAPIQPTPIMLLEVAADGITPVGSPTQILDRSDLDGPLIEAPSISFIGGRYFLFFSSNCYSSTLYDVSFATASSIYGPYTKGGPLLVTGTLGLSAPGGAEISANGGFIAFHAGPVGARLMYTARISSNGGTSITLCSNGGGCQSAS